MAYSPTSMSTEELQVDALERLWEQDREADDLIQIIDLELEDYDDCNEIDDRDGRSDVSEYEASMD